MIQRHFAHSLVAAAALLGGLTARAQTCGVAGEVFAQCPDTVGFSLSDPSVAVQSADDFILAAPTSITKVRWWGTYSNTAGTSYCGPQTDDFDVVFWSDTGGSGPDEFGLILDVSTSPITRSAAPVFQLDVSGETFFVFEYEIDLIATPVALAGSTTYWMELTNDLLPFPACKWGWIIDAQPSNGYYTYSTFQSGLAPWSAFTFPTATPGFDFSFALFGQGGVGVNYCTAGTSASGCTATLSAAGTPSASAPSGFLLSANGVEGNKDALFFLGTSGRQANSWGNGTSFQCVVPPVARAGILSGVGSSGTCDGQFTQDLTARWTAKPGQNPGAGAVVQAQLWYRDPQNTSAQSTSLSDALEFSVVP